MLIINADSYGESSQTNRGVLACFNSGVVTSTTICANMPAFDEAVEFANENGFVEHVGLHININIGSPLTNKIRYLPRFCNSHGIFNFQPFKNFHLSHDEQSALKDEIASQIEKCRSAGLPLSHADSHFHIHTELPVFNTISPVLKFYGIRNVRIASNIKNSGLTKKISQTLFNQILRLSGFHRTDFLGDLEDLQSWIKRSEINDYSIEIMVQPSVGDEGQVVDKISQQPLIDRLKDLIAGHEVGNYPLHEKMRA